MSYSEIQRKELIIPMTVFAGFLSAAGTESTKDEVSIFYLPWNCLIKGWSATYTDEAGTTPDLGLTLERGTTVLSTLTTLTTNETGARATGLSLRCDANEQLNIKGVCSNTDNAFDGLLIVVEVQIIPDA